MHLLNQILLAAALGGLVTLPLFGQENDGVMLENKVISTRDVFYESKMMPHGFIALDETTNNGVMATVFGLGTSKGFLWQTYLDQTGINFPDGSDQKSAAYSKSETDTLLASLAPTEAWPMVCKTDVLEGYVPDDLSYGTLFCRSPQPGVPGGDIGSAAGVPDGYFFVVTDVVATCGIGDNCDGVFLRVTRRNIIDNETDIERWAFPLSSTTPAGDTSVAAQFAGPLMILGPGDYLVGLASLSTSSGHSVFAQVMGYLTANPERFGR